MEFDNEKCSMLKEIEGLLISAQNNSTKTIHVKARIDKTQQNSKCRSCGERAETINDVEIEWWRIAQKEYKTRHEWVGNVIHWELCKELDSDLTTKWCMHKLETAQENVTQ